MTKHRNTALRSGARTGALNSQPTVLKDRDVGIPLSQDALEGQLPMSWRRDGGVLRVRREGVWPGPGAFTIGRTDAEDARDTGATPELRQTPADRDGIAPGRNMEAGRARLEHGLGATTLIRSPQKYRGDTMGLESKKRFPPQQPRSEHEQHEAPRRNSMPDNSGYPVRKSQENTLQHNGPRGETDLEARRRGGPNALRERMSPARRGGAQSGRAGRPRTSRSDEGDQPRSRKRNKEAAGGNDHFGKTSAEDMYNEEEKEYTKQKRVEEAIQSIAYEATDVNRKSFDGLGPAVVSGEWGMSEVLGGRLLLARSLLNGEYVEWHSKEQKADVMTLVERLKDEKKRNTSSSVSAEAEQQTQNLMQKLLGGKYEFTKPQQGREILGNVARHADRNESYFPMDQESLLEKVRSLMPANDIRKNKRA